MDKRKEGSQMSAKIIARASGKIVVCSLMFIPGIVIGGLVVSIMRLPAPVMPDGVDSSAAFGYLMLGTPILVTALAALSKGLQTRFLPRALILSIFAWVAYTLNTVIESLAFTATSPANALYTAISFLFPCIFSGAAVAWLFNPGRGEASVRDFFRRKSIRSWAWRLTIAAIAFIPVYLIFGTLVAPLTEAYFQQGLYGLQQPGWDEILVVLSLRSLMFFLVCLPVVMLWQCSPQSLFFRLGFALFVLVGFLYMLSAYYMPLVIRIPHTLEILADSFAYAGMLVLLLAKRGRLDHQVDLSEFPQTRKIVVGGESEL
jgi:hypothetical protein